MNQVADISNGERLDNGRVVEASKREFCVYVHFNSDSGQEFILFGSM